VLERITELIARRGDQAPRVADIRPGRRGHRRRIGARLHVARRARLHVTTAVIVAAAALAAMALVAAIVVLRPASTSASAGHTTRVVHTPISTAGTPITSPRPIESTAAGSSLDHLMVTTVPAGYLVDPSPGATSGAGPVDLSQAITDDGLSDARSFLTRAGFVQGLSQLWRTGDRHQLTVTIYQFKDPAGAAAYRQRRAGTAGSDPQATMTGFSVSGIPGATGLTRAKGDTVTASVSLNQAAYFVQVSANWYTAAGLQEAALNLARDQYRLL
jgi:hypothetical protein